ncbi:MAG: ribonuclease Z [Candidatus Woesearchaeota archaeon]
MIETTILGTSSMVPTKDRNHTAIITNFHNKEYILFDCGEGTQRQLRIANIKPTKIKKIFISHWHGDHTFGLIGLIQTIFATRHENDIKIYGPPNSKEKIDKLMDAFKEGESFDRFEEGEKVIYKSKHDEINLHIHEFKENDEIVEKDYKVIVKKLDHNVDTYGFRLVEKDLKKIKPSFVKKIESLNIKKGPWLKKLKRNKSVKIKDHTFKSKDAIRIIEGKKIGYVFDTKICDNIYDIVDNCDLVISEATYIESEKDKAEEYKHLTAKQIAQISSECFVKELVLIHFSQRYKSANEHEREAKLYFPNTTAAQDFMKFKV